MQYSRAFLPHPVLSRVFERLKDCTYFDTGGGLGHVHKLARCPAGWHRRTAQPLPSLRSVGRLQCGEQLEARLAASVRSSYQRLNDDGHSIRAVADEALTLAVTINALAHDAHELAPEARNVKCRRARTERQARRDARCGRGRAMPTVSRKRGPSAPLHTGDQCCPCVIAIGAHGYYSL